MQILTDLVNSIRFMYDYPNTPVEDLNRTTCEAKKTAGWRISITGAAGVRWSTVHHRALEQTFHPRYLILRTSHIAVLMLIRGRMRRGNVVALIYELVNEYSLVTLGSNP